ncbi:MAG: carbonic anhydrase [Lachnospiraceae bacterium]|nr:carbonic anhydrase [Lachnospiraceae bacterium]
MIDEILAYNKKFVEEKQYEKYAAGKLPQKKIAIVTCMDTRLTELLPAALGIKNGDCKIIKNAGGVVSSSFGSVVRSLLVAIIELGVEDVMIIGHTDCGVSHIDADMMIEHMQKRGINTDAIELIKYCGIDFEKWLAGFETVEKSVKETVDMLREHPLIPKDVRIGGYVIDTVTGELTEISKPMEGVIKSRRYE